MSNAQLSARSLGGQAVKDRPIPSDCRSCARKGYTRWHQHLGHLGAAEFYRRYRVVPALTSQWAIIRRADNTVVTIY